MTDFNNTPEQLKVMAEALGYDSIRLNKYNKVTGFPKNYLRRKIFNPKEDANQLLEIIGYLTSKGTLEINRMTKAYLITYDAGAYFGETLDDAVLLAYWESLK